MSAYDTLVEKLQTHIDREAKEQPKARQVGDVVPNVDAITIEWLNEVMAADHPGAEVTSFEIVPVSSGTHDRHRIVLEYNKAGTDAGLPLTAFTKSLPTLESRMIAGITGHARTESKFYIQVRPELDLEIPLLYQSTVDRDSAAAIHVLEDMSATKDATFCDFSTYVTKEMAIGQAELLAVLHGQYYDSPRLDSDFSWLAPFDKWFHGGVRKLEVDKYHEMAMTQAAHVIPDRLMDRRDEIWPALIESLKPHQEMPNTFLHSDVHIGNWYQTGDGTMGLCDWQCAVRGHWSRDLAYAMTAALQIEDRREWERDIVAAYVDKLNETSGLKVTLAEAFDLYRSQVFHALLMWTPTLCHSEHLPHMQPDEISYAMIERMTAAADDLDSIEACKQL